MSLEQVITIFLLLLLVTVVAVNRSNHSDHFTMTTSVDKGYSWLVLATCFTMRVLTEGFWSSLGILLVEWQTYFEASAGDVAIIGSMTLMVILLSGK